MANINSFPNNQDEYVGAEYAMHWLHGRTSGVYSAKENAKVIAVTSQMAVVVNDGDGWISNSEGNGVGWWINNKKETGEPLKLQVDLADGLLNRIDRVVVTWETTDYISLPTVTILKGTPAESPVPPTLTNNNVKRQISLAQISVKAGTISITQDMITDERADKTVCGFVTNDVEVDTSEMQRKFDEWFKSAQDVLDSNTAGKLVNMINKLNARVDLLENLFFNNISANKFTVLFETLDEVITNGVWNKQLQRIEC